MKIKRRTFVLAASAWPFAAIAQQPKKIYRIGYLSPGPEIEARDEAFRQRLRELGYVEGKNLVIEWRFMQGRPDRYAHVAVELAKLNVDCIAAQGAGVIRAAKQATDSIPIVMTTVDADPVESGFVASLSRPGGNVTGFTGIGYDLAAKRLELIKELVPKATRAGMLLAGPTLGDAQRAHFRGAENAARKLGMEIRLFAAQSPDELDTMFSRSGDWRPDVLSVFAGGWLNSHRARAVSLAARTKLPTIYSNHMFVPLGGLMSYATDIPHQFAEAANYVAKILAGVKPADLPVQQPTKFELAINRKTAKALGITIPPTIMVRADRVIE